MYNGKNVILSRNLRKNMTPRERKIWYGFLRAYPLRFYRQRTIGSYIADFYCSAVKLVIELDGSGHYDESRMEKDKKRTGYFESLGITVMRIPNNDVWNNFDGVCTAIDLQAEKLKAGQKAGEEVFSAGENSSAT